VSKRASRTYNLSLAAIPVVSLGVLYFFTGAFTTLVDFAAGIAFVSAPVLAFFNYRLVTAAEFPEAARLGPVYQGFSAMCLVLLALFAVAYLVWRVGLF
jgi:hypothetical protein